MNEPGKRCAKQVWKPHDKKNTSGHWENCKRPPVIEEEGLLWCGLHKPSRFKDKDGKPILPRRGPNKKRRLKNEKGPTGPMVRACLLWIRGEIEDDDFWIYATTWNETRNAG